MTYRKVTKCVIIITTNNDFRVTVTGYETVCFYHDTYAYQSGCTLYSCLDIKELLSRHRRVQCT